MEAKVTWAGGMKFEAVSGSGHALTVDGSRADGASPMELLLVGAGGCSSIDVVLILEKMRQVVTGVSCQVSGDRADTEPKVYTAINMHFTVEGRGLDEAKVARAIALSAEKYCSASIMLGKTAKMTHSYEIIEAND